MQRALPVDGGQDRRPGLLECREQRIALGPDAVTPPCRSTASRSDAEVG